MGSLVVVNTVHFLKVFGEISVALYMLLVAIGYMTEGSRFSFKFDPHFPIYSTQRFLVGLGVRLLAWGLRVGSLMLAPLYEASAEVGEWVAQHASPAVQSRFRSRII